MSQHIYSFLYKKKILFHALLQLFCHIVMKVGHLYNFSSSFICVFHVCIQKKQKDKGSFTWKTLPPYTIDTNLVSPEKNGDVINLKLIATDFVFTIHEFFCVCVLRRLFYFIFRISTINAILKCTINCSKHKKKMYINVTRD